MKTTTSFSMHNAITQAVTSRYPSATFRSLDHFKLRAALRTMNMDMRWHTISMDYQSASRCHQASILRRSVGAHADAGAQSSSPRTAASVAGRRISAQKGWTSCAHLCIKATMSLLTAHTARIWRAGSSFLRQAQPRQIGRVTSSPMQASKLSWHRLTLHMPRLRWYASCACARCTHGSNSSGTSNCTLMTTLPSNWSSAGLRPPRGGSSSAIAVSASLPVPHVQLQVP